MLIHIFQKTVSGLRRIGLHASIPRTLSLPPIRLALRLVQVVQLPSPGPKSGFML
jgi:hypothetical protein